MRSSTSWVVRARTELEAPVGQRRRGERQGMSISRRRLVHSLGAGVLGASALSACGEGMPRGRRGRRRPTTTAPTADALSEPEQPLVLGSIGASYGRSAPFEQAIAIGLSESHIDVNHRFKGLFGQDVQLFDRHVMAEAGEDLTGEIGRAHV